MKDSILAKLPSYERYKRGRGTLDRGYPWLTVGAMLALDKVVLKPHFIVMELGCGGSTIFFAERCAKVLSIDTDPEWGAITRQALEKRGLQDRVVLQTPELPNRRGERKRVRQDLARLIARAPNDTFDLLLVDHTGVRKDARPNRLQGAIDALPKLKQDGWLVFDNYKNCRLDSFDFTGWTVHRFDQMEYSGGGTLLARRDSTYGRQAGPSDTGTGVDGTVDLPCADVRSH